MKTLTKYRIPALLCALAVLLCELIAQPFTTMGICDDGPYILMAHTLATTGHIVYNGWEAAMILLQLYLGAAFIKLFGFSFTTVRMSTLLVSLALALLLHRTIARCGIHERNATLGTLAFVLSPLYLMLSVTFMSDITGLFAIVICLYGCLRTLQSNTQRAALLWLAFAVATNVFFGTSRQIAWLGTLVMVPCTLWLLRAQRRVLIIGAALNLAGFVAIFACLQWLKHQRYVVAIPLLTRDFRFGHAFGQLGFLLLDSPFLVLPLTALFLPQLRRARPRTLIVVAVLFAAFVFVATYPSHLRGDLSYVLEPVAGMGSWVTVHGIIDILFIPGKLPVYLNREMQLVLTALSMGGLLGLIFLLRKSHRGTQHPTTTRNTSWAQLTILIAPSCAVYCFLLLANAGTTYFLYDRYALGVLVVALPCLLRLYQERVQSQIPLASICLIAIMAAYGVALTHNTFSVDRARVAIADEIHGSGVPDTSLDDGWEYNIDVELEHADHINNRQLQTAANGYTPVPPLPPGSCPMTWYDRTPHIHPLYSISFDPNACYGPARFAPVHYSRWPYKPGTLYVVRTTPLSPR